MSYGEYLNYSKLVNNFDSVVSVLLHQRNAVSLKILF